MIFMMYESDYVGFTVVSKYVCLMVVVATLFPLFFHKLIKLISKYCEPRNIGGFKLNDSLGNEKIGED